MADEIEEACARSLSPTGSDDTFADSQALALEVRRLRAALAEAQKQAASRVGRAEPCHECGKPDSQVLEAVGENQVSYYCISCRAGTTWMPDWGMKQRAERAEAALQAIKQTDGKAREVVKDILGMNPDAGERMWYETAQRLMGENTDLKARDEARLPSLKTQEHMSVLESRCRWLEECAEKSEALAKEQERRIGELLSVVEEYRTAVAIHIENWHGPRAKEWAELNAVSLSALKALTSEPAKEAAGPETQAAPKRCLSCESVFGVEVHHINPCERGKATTGKECANPWCSKSVPCVKCEKPNGQESR